MSGGEWQTIESDPAVFDEYITDKLGAKGLAVEEILCIEPDTLSTYENVYGLIFLFKYGTEKSSVPPSGGEANDLVYFAQQVVPNACSTVALVNTLCNLSERVDIGSTLKDFLEATLPLDPNSRGIAIGSREDFREFQNSFAPPNSFAAEGPQPRKQESDVFHYISFIYKYGAVWELDGLQPGPKRCAEAGEENYKVVLMDVVQRRVAEIMETDKSGKGQGISFNLMVLIDDPIEKLEKRISEAQAQGQSVEQMNLELAELRELKKIGRESNERRRHDYNPMIFALLKALAEKGQLQPLLDEMKKKKQTQ